MSEQPDILDGLEERLQSHAKAFESLLALTPAQDYYGSQVVDGRDPSEQWKAKKQTKEEKAAAKKAKLDPANQKSALDIMKERELKRKRELGMDENEDAGEGEDAKVEKKQKVEETAEEAEARRRQKAEKRKEKREKKKEKAAKLKTKREAKKAAKQEDELNDVTKRRSTSQLSNGTQADDDSDDEPAQAIGDSEMGKLDMSGLVDTDDDAQNGTGASAPSTAPSSPAIESAGFDTSAAHSTASSSSSIVPPSDQPTSAPTKATNLSVKQQPLPTLDTDTLPKARSSKSGTDSPRINIPNINQEGFQERLRKRILELRGSRKADDDSRAPQSRQELLEQRRSKEEARKARKKELRKQQKEDEARKQEERLRGSGSPLSVDIFSPRETPKTEQNSFSFSRLAFGDGATADANLSGLVDARKKKGPQDTRTALAAAEAKQKRIAGYDAEKRADIAEKDLWLNAKKRAHGERVRDDTSLLKKALKRKEKAKGKSETEWKERNHAVVRGKELKQKKREENLQKRRDEKGVKGKKKKAAVKSGGKKSRPGFEGRFKA